VDKLKKRWQKLPALGMSANNTQQANINAQRDSQKQSRCAYIRLSGVVTLSTSRTTLDNG